MTYISRLQSVQAAIESQIKTMAETTPTRRVGLVTFSGDVVVHGDGTSEARTVAGDRLSDFDFLVNAGSTFPLDKPVRCMRTVLSLPRAYVSV